MWIFWPPDGNRRNRRCANVRRVTYAMTAEVCPSRVVETSEIQVEGCCVGEVSCYGGV
jgi:hypothetical protein